MTQARTPPELQVRLTALGTRAELEAAVTVLAASFQDAPNFVAAFPDAGARQRALPHIFRLLVRDAAALGGVTVAVESAQVIGAAVWFPPGQAKLTFQRQLRALPDMFKAFAVAPASFIRFARLGGELEKRRPPEPHAHLAALGVSTARQAYGIGSALLKVEMTQADALGRWCYLETFSEANVRFYRRYRFSVMGKGDDLSPDGPPFWFMARPPGNGRIKDKRLGDELEL